MFDIDSGKLLIVAVLALIVIGPKELPRVLRQVGQSIGKLRRMAGEFQGQFMDAMKEADIADIRKELDDLNKSAALDVHFDPVRDIQSELTGVMEAKPHEAVAAPSPVAGFELPAAGEIAELDSAAAGIAPVGEHEASDVVTVPEADVMPAALNGATVHLDAGATPKRRILIKRRTSRSNIVQADSVAQRTGEPLLVRRRSVRMKTSPSDAVPLT